MLNVRVHVLCGADGAPDRPTGGTSKHFFWDERQSRETRRRRKVMTKIIALRSQLHQYKMDISSCRRPTRLRDRPTLRPSTATTAPDPRCFRATRDGDTSASGGAGLQRQRDGAGAVDTEHEKNGWGAHPLFAACFVFFSVSSLFFVFAFACYYYRF